MEARVGPQRRREAMPNVFDFTSPPFDRLRPREVERVERAVDVVFLRQGERVLARGAMPDHVYVLIKGLVEERDGGEVVALHEPGELFDASVLLHKACRHEFVVREEAICYRLPIEDFLELTANNPSFAAFFLEDISHRLESLAQRTAQPGSVGALTVRVSDALIHPPVFVPPGTSLHEAALRMDEADQQALLLEDDGRTGIVTGVDLVRAGVRDRRPLETPVREVARFDLVGVGEDEFLFEAALLMTRARVRHLVVRRAGEIVGVLDAANVLSSMANRAATVANLIDRAAGPPELAEAGERIAALVRQLHTAGTKIGFVTEISTELQRRLTARIFGLLAPEGLADRACLVVMGSEGRGESLLATDQDNGLILADGVEPEPLQGFRRRLVEALVTVGFPLCPGDIMVTNPKWAKPEAAWRDDLRRAVLEPGEQALMDVATLVDAAPVAGRADLLERVKAHLFDLLADNQAFHARFALAIEAFGQGHGILGGLLGRGEERLDLKKAGIFPLMHGVRALALERRLPETGTVPRIRRLAEAGLFDKPYAQQLTDAFGFLLGLRLSHGLECLRLHRPPDNLVSLADLTKLERDLLKESLRIVRGFRELVRHHFRLGMF